MGWRMSELVVCIPMYDWMISVSKGSNTNILLSNDQMWSGTRIKEQNNTNKILILWLKLTTHKTLYIAYVYRALVVWATVNTFVLEIIVSSIFCRSPTIKIMCQYKLSFVITLVPAIERRSLRESLTISNSQKRDGSRNNCYEWINLGHQVLILIRSLFVQ